MSVCPTCGGSGFIICKEELEHQGVTVSFLVQVECPDCGIQEEEAQDAEIEELPW